MKKAVETSLSPAPIGPYSQATLKSGTIFVSGQIGLNAKTGQMMQETIEIETKQVMQNIEYILTDAGFTWAEVMKSSIFLLDLNDFNAVNSVYASFLTNPYPARETVQVSRLPKDARVEISVIAIK